MRGGSGCIASEVLQETPANARCPGRNALHFASANGALPSDNGKLYAEYVQLLVFHVASALFKMQPPATDTVGLTLLFTTLATLVFSHGRL